MAPLALLSVSDKTGIIDLARTLIEQYGFEIVSSGGTATALKDAGLPVTKVSEYTGAPEILGGRVKTLHPKIHGGILSRPDLPADAQDLETNAINPISVIVVNLYPFEQTVLKPDVTVEQAIEQIDIGGPSMIRGAAKNHQYITVLSNPSQYDEFVAELALNDGKTTLGFRQRMAMAAFHHTASYDETISRYLRQQFDPTLASSYTLMCSDAKPLRYGENPHQPATWYQTGTTPRGWSAAQQLQGKELSYNNLLDLEAARSIVAEFVSERGTATVPTAVIVKHNNPCGVATGATLAEAYDRAFQADATSAFGGIVALNAPIDLDTANLLTNTFLECVVAPACLKPAAEVLAKKTNLRVLVLPDLRFGATETVKTIAGGVLVQRSDDAPVQPETWQVVTSAQPTPDQMSELVFAWKVCRHVKSNAITVTKGGVTVGIGAGQMNRVGSAQIAFAQAGESSQGAVLASDGFLPFDDTVRAAAAAGITAIVQPGGSKRDEDSIKAADELGIVMVFTGVRHFLH
jgi:phosphoribosylaminoimidazolecarboxamide formyltransferase/IMP cyclohydrolase